MKNRLRLVPALVGALGLPAANLAISACKGGLDPGGGPDVPEVTTTAAQVTATNLGTVDTIPSISCDITITTTFTGSKDDQVAWGSGIFRFFAGKDRSVPVDSQTLTADQQQDAWRGPPGLGSHISYWRFIGGFPFSVDAEFHYQRSDGQASNAPSAAAKANFTCGPTVPASTPLPTLTAVTVTPSGAATYGDTLAISYTMNSPVGIWASVVEVCDVVKLYFERNQSAATRTVNLPLPPGCTPNTAVATSIIAADFLAQLARTSPGGPTVFDNVRPRLTVSRSDAFGSSGVRGYLYVGDTLSLDLSASDNGLVRTIVWLLPTISVRDSILVNKSSAGITQKIVMPPSWAGADSILFFARDAVGLVSDTSGSGPSLLTIGPTYTHPTISGSFAGGANVLVTDSHLQHIYVLDKETHRVFVISAQTLATERSIQVPSYPSDLDLTVSEDSLAVSLPYQHSVAFIDLKNASLPYSVLPVTVADTANGELPILFRITQSGRLFITLQNAASNGYRVAEINLGTGVQRIRTDAGNGPGTGSGAIVGRSADRKTLVFTGGGSTLFQRYDDAADVFGPTRGTPADILPVVSPDGSFTAVKFTIYDADLLPKWPVNVVAHPANDPVEAFTSDPGYVFDLSGRYVYQMKLSDGKVAGRFFTPAPGWIWTTPGSSLITTQAKDDGSSRIAIIDLSR